MKILGFLLTIFLSLRSWHLNNTENSIQLVLFKSDILEKIVTGKITRVYRLWKKPMVIPGGTQLTQAGLLKIIDIQEVDAKKLTSEELRDSDQSIASLQKLVPKNGILFEIRVQFEGADPRISLRNKALENMEDYHDLKIKLDKYDKSRYGPWTQILDEIKKHPGNKAQILADNLGFEKLWLKTQIRKLKALGLTISLEVGYILSTRGLSYLEWKNK